jgi:hypothetical protein
MARPGNVAAEKVLGLLTATPGLNSNLDTIGQIVNLPLSPIAGNQIVTRNVAVDLSEKSGNVKYPVVLIYCDKLSNSLKEKFRTFSGQANMVVEIRLSQDKIDGLDSALEMYVDAVTQILDSNRGDWGQGLFYAGGYEVAFGPIKQGGRNYIQIAKITFEVGASTN